MLLAAAAAAAAIVLSAADGGGERAAEEAAGPPGAAPGTGLVKWTPGVTCPAGAFEYDDHKKYGEMGFECERCGSLLCPCLYESMSLEASVRTGIGEVVGFPTTGVGNPQSCCQMSGGDGIGVRYGPHDDIGMFYSMCNPSLGCKDPAKKYTCTTYKNVTGKKPSPGMLSGHAQAPVGYAGAAPAASLAGGVNYGNPYAGPCKAGNASGGLLANGEVNATVRWQTGAICAPWCGCPITKPGTPSCQGGFVECPTEVPPGTTATPQCLLARPRNAASSDDGGPPSHCGLVCDPSDPSGTGGAASRCPKGATCKPLYTSNASKAVRAVSYCGSRDASLTRSPCAGDI